MASDTTQTKTFEIRAVGEMIRSPKGHTSIECETDAGTVAFWGGKSLANLKALQQREPPFRVRCGCRQPLPNFPTHAWWVPETAQLEFLRDGDPVVADEEAPIVRHAFAPGPLTSPFGVHARPSRDLFVVGATKSTIWDDDPGGQAGAFVPALYAYRGRSVRDWLASAERAKAAHWLFLSPRYGFIEPDHPVARAITDEALRLQVEYQRRWSDRVALRDFQTVYVWCDSTAIEDRVRTPFELVGAKVVRLKALSRRK
jgi:hypothetical protein